LGPGISFNCRLVGGSMCGRWRHRLKSHRIRFAWAVGAGGQFIFFADGTGLRQCIDEPGAGRAVGAVNVHGNAKMGAGAISRLQARRPKPIFNARRCACPDGKMAYFVKCIPHGRLNTGFVGAQLAATGLFFQSRSEQARPLRISARNPSCAPCGQLAGYCGGKG
jgi:hypothetical protein